MEEQQTPDEMANTIEDLEARADIDRALIDALEAEGTVDRSRINELRDALIMARRIGAGIGIIMGARRISEDEAFAVLVKASQHSNRKLRQVADELCVSGDVSSLP
jgi:ANTAR domain